ncbi:MAG: 4Fe-4S binding protein [Anaerolineae bacterium]|nr:4Fe-4S binding protein [Anaerolineae bacterium]
MGHPSTGIQTGENGGNTVRHTSRTGFLRPSTRAFHQEGKRTPGYSFSDWMHGYVYARWPYLYIGIATGEHPLARAFGPLVRGLGRLFPPRASDVQDPDRVTFADTYHGKVLPLESAKRLVTVRQEIRLTDLEQVIPYARARDIVMQDPDHIVVLECPCRTVRSEPCLPLDVCLIVGEPFASFVAEHHPRRSRWITQDEAVEVLRAEHERGHVHHAFFKDAMLGRFYAICNCCSCCCGAMQAHQGGTPMLASSGYVNQVDAALCEGCGECAEMCPFGALAVREGLAAVDLSACMGCGACISRCKRGALALVRDPSRGEPLEIHELMDRAASDHEFVPAEVQTG